MAGKRGKLLSLDSFFDSNAVLIRLGAAQAKVLSKFGSYVRRTAKTLLRRKGGKTGKRSRPGQPPRQQTGLLRDFVFFSYESTQGSVVVGPEKLNGMPSDDMPRTLEEGGPAEVSYGPYKGDRFTMLPRPYMGPALRQNQNKLAPLWKDRL